MGNNMTTKKELLDFLKDFDDDAVIKCSYFDSGAYERILENFKLKDVFINKDKTVVEFIL